MGDQQLSNPAVLGDLGGVQDAGLFAVGVLWCLRSGEAASLDDLAVSNLSAHESSQSGIGARESRVNC